VSVVLIDDQAGQLLPQPRLRRSTRRTTSTARPAAPAVRTTARAATTTWPASNSLCA